MRLQRVIVDFGADDSFEKAQKKIKEHYNIDAPKSSIRLITEAHAEKIKELKKEIQQFDKKKPAPIVDVIIGEVDGTMLPTVITDSDASDKRKGKTHVYREARQSLAYRKGSVHPIYDASFGTTDEIGEQIVYCVNAAGRKGYTILYFVSDGAPWIFDQIEKHFGCSAKYVIDFYHMSQYLADASQCCSPRDKESWRRSMQTLMKEGKITQVLNFLESHIEETTDDHVCPAASCYNYFIKRLTQFDYKGALEKGLPIGSGKVESGHRNIIQKRLKIPGAWWKLGNADSILSLRIIRENGFWDNYWSGFAGKPN